MGLCLSYMDTPDTKKHSSDESNEKLNCGTSSMQGWRDSQQDAHNCIINFDTDTAYFAVYDGHGGDEVALYCSLKLPDFIKELDDYKSGNIEKALEEAFLQFDGTLTNKEVCDTLQKIKDAAYEKQRKRNRCKHSDDDDDDEEEDVDNLYEEASMPIEELIQKYKSGEIYKNIAERLKKQVSSSNSSTTNNPSTTDTPETSGEIVSTSSCVKNDITSKSDNQKDEKTVSNESKSETNEADNSSPIIDTKVESPDSSADAREICTPSDETAGKDNTNQNGEVESTQDCESSKPDVSSSSATPYENGEVIKKGKGKAATKTKGVVPQESPTQRPKRSAKLLYKSILNMEECSEEESEDDKDETFQGPNDESSEDDEEVVSGENSEESSVGEEGEEEEKDDDNEEDDDEDDGSDYDQRDSEFLENMKDGPGMDSGTTAVVALLKGNELYVANAGDSRCIVCRNGQAIEMSLDHKPEDKIEYNRIKKAGGYVNFEGRVNGGLNLSRAIGDHAYKQNKDITDREQTITALPDIKTLTIKPDEDEFMVLACDGIWNSLSSQEVVDFVRLRIQEGREKLSQICEEMFDHCLAPHTLCDGQGCDNMTAVIVQFKGKNSLKKPLTDPEESGRSKRLKLDEEEVAA